jgi:ribose 5-phosphate isomerase B
VKVAVAADHNGVALKSALVSWLVATGHEVDDRAGDVGEEPVDYPPLCEDVCRRVLDGSADFGVIVGGGGSGETIACNKLAGIRAVLCHSVWGAEIGRGNNDGNVLVVGAKVIDEDVGVRILEAWLETPFKGAEHARRLAMISALERGESLL